MSDSTALRLTGRDVLPLLHRTTSNALEDLLPGSTRATLFCDFRGRLLHRAVVAITADGAVWLLRNAAPGAELAAAVDRMVFRDDVRIEDHSEAHIVQLAEAGPGDTGVLGERDGVPLVVAAGDGTLLALDRRAALSERARIAHLVPRHGHEIAEAFNPFEVGLAREVHLAKGCFTGQEALQRLITYDSVRRRPVRVRLAAAVTGVPADVHANGERVGVLTSVADQDGFAIVRNEVVANGAKLTLADGTALEVVDVPVLPRPLGRP
jgi:tRNA-modifying protein YgfZ